MIQGKDFVQKLYSTGNDELDNLLEKAFCEGYEYAQKEFARGDYEGLNPQQQSNLKQARSSLAMQLLDDRRKANSYYKLGSDSDFSYRNYVYDDKLKATKKAARIVKDRIKTGNSTFRLHDDIVENKLRQAGYPTKPSITNSGYFGSKLSSPNRNRRPPIAPNYAYA